MQHRIFLAVATAYLIAANLAWIAMDTRPPFWDMAAHESSALRIHEEFSSHGWAAFKSVPQESGSYPPLYYLVVSLFYATFGRSVDAAQFANLPAMVLLGLSTYGIARFVLPPTAAAFAGALVNFFPYMLWLSRETLIEYWLAAMVAAGLWALMWTDRFSHTGRSLLFGAVCGLGMLTKWTFALYIAVPAVWLALRNWKNALAAAAVAAGLAAYWYVPQASTMPAFWNQVAVAGSHEGDPPLGSWSALVFYLRALEGYQLFLPLFLLLAIGTIWVARRRSRSWTPVVLCLVGGWLGLLLIGNKDPRYSAPLLSAVAVVAAAPIGDRKWAVAALSGLLLFQHYLVSFGVRQLPETVVLRKGSEGLIPQHWNLYSQSYYGIWGPPRSEDWPIEAVLMKVSSHKPVRLGLIPDIPRFDSSAFNFYVRLREYPVIVNQLWAYDPPHILNNDYIVLAEGDQGYLRNNSPDTARINNFVLSDSGFELVGSFTLPSGQPVRLYKSPPPDS